MRQGRPRLNQDNSFNFIYFPFSYCKSTMVDVAPLARLACSSWKGDHGVGQVLDSDHQTYWQYSLLYVINADGCIWD